MKSFLSDRPRVASPESPRAQASAFAPAGQHGVSCAVSDPGATTRSPVVECVREGDRIVRLVVTCGCGERVEIDCLYAAGV
jgi:hypothetical protein